MISCSAEQGLGIRLDKCNHSHSQKQLSYEQEGETQQNNTKHFLSGVVLALYNRTWLLVSGSQSFTAMSELSGKAHIRVD